MAAKRQSLRVAIAWRQARRRIARVLLVLFILSPTPGARADPQLRVIVHPSRTDKLTRSDVGAIYLKQKTFWEDGQAIVPINRAAGSETRELFSERTLGQNSRRLANYWNQRYFEAGEFPPATLGSEEAVVRFVGSNPNAIGYVSGEKVDDSVSVVLVLP